MKEREIQIVQIVEIKKPSKNMDFVLVKSTKENDMGTISFRYTPSSIRNVKGKGLDGTNSKCARGVDTQIKKKSKNNKRAKVSLGIFLSKEEWNSYTSGDYIPKEEMKSLGITYEKFSRFMDVIRATVSENRDEEGMKFIVQSAMLKLITED